MQMQIFWDYLKGINGSVSAENVTSKIDISARGCFHGGRKILEGETNFRLVDMQKFRSGWLLKIK